MAAIIEPHPRSTRCTVRPLRLVAVDGRRVDEAAPLLTPPAVLLLALAVLLVAGSAVFVGRGGLADLAPSPPSAASAPATRSSSGPAEVVTVRPGDTLWSIARRIRPAGDVRPLVDRLVAAHPAVLQPGERLTIPASNVAFSS